MEETTIFSNPPTLNELIECFTKIIRDSPERGNLPVWVYNPDFGDIMPIVMIDNSVSDRIDINVPEGDDLTA